MTPPLRIQLMAGPQAGLQTTHTDARISYGREPGNTVTLDDAHLSRRHGELVCENGEWAVVNLSPNGTTVNGRKVKGDQPRVLKPGDVVGVGKVKLFAVQFQPVAPGAGAAVQEDDDAAAPVDAGNRMSRRAKLWTGLGIYGGVVLVILLVLITMGGGGDDGGGGKPDQFPRAQIVKEIEAPYEREPDEGQANFHLEQARESYPQIGSRDAGLFNTYRHYKLALAFSDRRTLEGLDQLRLVEVQNRLIDEITDDYQQAYIKVTKQQWIGAERALRDLIAKYPNNGSPLWDHVNRLLKYVLSRRGR